MTCAGRPNKYASAGAKKIKTIAAKQKENSKNTPKALKLFPPRRGQTPVLKHYLITAKLLKEFVVLEKEPV